ncbi:MAG: DMT family transporter [Lentilitoribacter sp.]
MSSRLTKIVPILFVWIWSTGFINAKYALPYIEPFYFLFIRMVLAALAFLILIYVLKKRWPTRNQALMQMIIGVLLHSVYLGGVFFAVHLGMPAGISSIFVGLHPALTALLGFIFLSQKLKFLQSVGLAFGFIGISLVVIGSNNIDGSALSTLGLITCVLSLLGMSISGILQKLYAQNVPLVSGTFYQYLGGSLALIPISLLLENHEVIMTFELVAAMVWSVLALSVGAILLLMFMIREGEVAKVASYFYLVPPVTVIQTYFLFDERLGLVAITGCILAVLGVYLVAKQSGKTN